MEEVYDVLKAVSDIDSFIGVMVNRIFLSHKVITQIHQDNCEALS
jgi:hypothetical protein